MGGTPPEPLRHTIEATKAVDLTHRLRPSMPVWPGDTPFSITRTVDHDQGYRLHDFAMGEGVGTHVDAPSHFAAHGMDADGLALRDLVVPTVVIDITAQAAADPDFRLSADELAAWEVDHGAIPEGGLVVLNSGWHTRFADPQAYGNVDGDGVMHFPGFAVGAAEALLLRNIAGVGVDTLSPDGGNAADFAVHRTLLGAGKFQIENLANLDALPAVGASVVIGILPVEGASQAQARVLALLP